MNVLYRMTSGAEMTLSSFDCDAEEKIYLSCDSKEDEVLEFLKIVKRSNYLFEEFLANPYRAMKKTLDLSDDEAFLSIPKVTLDNRIESITEQLQITLNDLENKDYLVTYLTIKRFLRGLSRPLIDQQKLDKVISQQQHEGVKNAMTALRPDKQGLAKQTVYSMCGSNTGRLIVSDGPNILTMKSDARIALKSRYQEGKILQLDLSAAEPNIALNVCGKSIEKDVYTHISEEVLEGKVSRDDSKLIVLCALYGQSPTKLQKMLPEEIRAHTVIRKCREFFDANYLEKMLRTTHRNNNLRNVVGRPISLTEDQSRLLVSYYLQSSAAELSLVMFADLCDRLYQLKKKITPLYVIHDALIADCDKDLSEELLAKKIINLQMGDWKFHAKVTEIS